MKNISIRNKRAFHNYHVLEKYEAGIALTGCEVKSIRQGKANLQDSFARIVSGELWLFNCHINPFSEGNRYNEKPTRDRKLLMHRREINKLTGKVEQKGFLLIPISMYFSRNKLKVQIALCKSKKLHDKRRDLKEKAVKRDLEQKYTVKGI
ncbi:SsrA-binding protein SmpB [Candidatus Margulisiibacteriota bacterium]